MPVRYPPTDKIPPAVRGGRGPRPQARIVAYDEPGVGFWRRFVRLVLSPPVIVPLVFVTALVIGVLFYYWGVFSRRIDNLLKGEVFTRSAGIYAAPKLLRVGENISEEEVIAYLKRAGYVEKGQQADIARGRYGASGNTVDVEPSQETTVDGQHQYQRL